MEALAATALLRENFPELKVRFINIVDLFKLEPETEHLHGLSDRDFDSLFTIDKPIIFNFHGYPWLIHKLAYRRTNHKTFTYAAIRNMAILIPRSSSPCEPNRSLQSVDGCHQPGSKLRVAGAHVKDWLKNQIIENTTCHEYGIDKPELTNWKWPY